MILFVVLEMSAFEWFNNTHGNLVGDLFLINYENAQNRCPSRNKK